MDKMIRFNGQNIKIKYKDKTNDQNMGRYLEKEACIEIDDSMPEDLQRAVLVHECVHMVLMQQGDFNENDNESFVQRLSNSIFQLYELNSELLLKASNG